MNGKNNFGIRISYIERMRSTFFGWGNLHYLTLMSLGILLSGCSKDEDPEPEDLFVGGYQLAEVIEEFDPQEPGSEDERFLAPATFEITKDSFLDPITGEFFPAYKIFIDGDFIMGLSLEGTTKLVGSVTCPASSDIQSVELEIVAESHQLTLLSCQFRNAIASYNQAAVTTE